jgi:hypothetical protein
MASCGIPEFSPRPGRIARIIEHGYRIVTHGPEEFRTDIHHNLPAQQGPSPWHPQRVVAHQMRHSASLAAPKIILFRWTRYSRSSSSDAPSDATIMRPVICINECAMVFLDDAPLALKLAF